MVARRQPIDRVIDLAVGLPVATVVAARRSVPILAQAARLGLRRVSRRGRTSGTPAVPHTDVVDPPLIVERAIDVVELAAPMLPIDDYDHLAARQVVDRLATLSPTELDAVAVYERANRHRQTVLGRIAQLQS